ncbi:MAG: hypothetical protein JKY19_01500 [Alcanivoracaceae bacterium]|nr:hypothetical protein [Alcanivoracaceae bacterium]
MQIFYNYLIAIFIISVTFAAFAQIGGFCLLGGLRESIKDKSTPRLWSYFIVIAVAMVGTTLREGKFETS